MNTEKILEIVQVSLSLNLDLGPNLTLISCLDAGIWTVSAPGLAKEGTQSRGQISHIILPSLPSKTHYNSQIFHLSGLSFYRLSSHGTSNISDHGQFPTTVALSIILSEERVSDTGEVDTAGNLSVEERCNDLLMPLPGYPLMSV